MAKPASVRFVRAATCFAIVALHAAGFA